MKRKPLIDLPIALALIILLIMVFMVGGKVETPPSVETEVLAMSFMQNKVTDQSGILRE